MHVHELNPKKTLISMIIFALIILVGILTVRKPIISYQLDNEASLKVLNNSDACFYPYQLTGVLNKTNNEVVLIDLRDKFSFGQGHIPGAENISAYDLTDKDNIERMKAYKEKGITVVLYGNNQLQANGPWMLFRQVGFDNVKILLGGYDYYKKHKNALAETKDDKSYMEGFARYDYAKVANNSTPGGLQENTQAKKPVIVKRRKKTKAVSGGC